MTTVELAHRALRHSPYRDPAQVPVDDALDLVDAINAALQEFYSIAPPVYSRTTLSGELYGESTVSLTLTNGESTFGSDVFLASQRGYTIKLGDESKYNEITGTDSLLDVYAGTSGTYDCPVWGDVIQFSDTSIKRVVSPPRIEGCSHGLVNDPSIREYVMREGRSVGVPRFYYVEPVGSSQGGRELCLVRFAPLPDKQYTVRMEVELTPTRYGYQSLVTPATLPVENHQVESLLLPLLFDELLDRPGWVGTSAPAQRIMERAQRARDEIKLLPAYLAPNRNKIGTPKGW